MSQKRCETAGIITVYPAWSILLLYLVNKKLNNTKRDITPNDGYHPVFYQAFFSYFLVSNINQSINQSISNCLCSSATSRIIVCKECSDDNVRIWSSEEPGFKLLTERRERLRRRYLLWQSVPDTGSSNRERLVTDCWTSDRWHHQMIGATRA